MGQYHILVNLDKMEFVNPHSVGCGLKLWEQIANSPGTGAALIVLLASHSNGSGGGDLKYAPIVGRWRGDRIAFVGDYDDGITYQTHAGPLTGAEIYGKCGDSDGDAPVHWIDVSLEVARQIELELDGKYDDTQGWRQWRENKAA